MNSNKEILAIVRRFLPGLGFLIVFGCGAVASDMKKKDAPNAVTVAPSPVASLVEELPTHPQTVATDPAVVAIEEPTAPASEVSSGEITIVPYVEYAEAYHADEKLKNYGDRTIDVSVVVGRISLQGWGSDENVTIAGDNSLRPAEFLVNRATRQPWAWIAPGQVVTLRRRKVLGPRGKFEWDIVKFGANPAPIITATSLAEEFLSDPVIAAQKYNDKPVCVSGKVLETETLLTHRIILEGSKKLNVVLDCKSVPSAQSIKVGQQIYGYGVIGVLRITSSFPNEVGLVDAMPITIPFPVKGVINPASMTDSDRLRATWMRESTPDFKLTMDEYEQAMKGNSEVGNKLPGRIIELSGTINSFVSRKESDIIDLTSGLKTRGIWCKMIDPEPWKTYTPGQAVHIRGRHGFLGRGLEQSVVVSAEPLAEPLTTFSVEEVIKLHSKDSDEFYQTWKDRPFEIVGELESINLKGYPHGFSLKGKDNASVTCAFPVVETDEDIPSVVRFRKHAIGDQIRVITRIDSNFYKADFLALQDGRERPLSP